MYLGCQRIMFRAGTLSSRLHDGDGSTTAFIDARSDLNRFSGKESFVLSPVSLAPFHDAYGSWRLHGLA